MGCSGLTQQTCSGREPCGAVTPMGGDAASAATVFAAHSAAGWGFEESSRHGVVSVCDASGPPSHPLPPPPSCRRPNTARQCRRGGSTGAGRSGRTITAPPGPMSQATARTWSPALQAAAAAYGLIPAVDPALLTRQVLISYTASHAASCPATVSCAIAIGGNSTHSHCQGLTTR